MHCGPEIWARLSYLFAGGKSCNRARRAFDLCVETLSNPRPALARCGAEDQTKEARARQPAKEGEVSLDLLPFERRTLSDQIVTWWWVETSHVRRVAVGADKCFVLVDRGEFLVQVFALPNLVMTLST